MTIKSLEKPPLSFAGKVVSGKGEAVFFTRLDWVQDQFQIKIGFLPYPGTLNLQVSSDNLWSRIEHADAGKTVELMPTDPSFCSGTALPATICGIQVAIILPEEKVRTHGKNIVEIMAPICLRDAFSLTDGDAVTVMLNDPTPQEPMSIKAAIFDLDGTLIDSTHVYYAIIEAAFDRLGLPVVPRSKILEAARQDEFDWNLVLSPEALQSNPQLIDEVRQQINALYPDIFNQHVIPIPGTYETLTKIVQTGAPIGVVTSTPNANMGEKRAIIEKYDIEPLIDVIITTDDTERRKPAPDPLYLCALKLGIPAEDCVYVGDMISDIQAGKNAGMKTIAVLTGFDNYNTLKSTNPDALIPSVAQFHQAVKID